jgi:mannose-6-phosphate isomerase-like protein (cupin superfamily)
MLGVERKHHSTVSVTTTDVAPIILGPGQGMSIQFGPGEHFLFRATAQTTGGQFSLFEITAQPVAGPPEHVHHDHDETYLVLEGTFAVKVGERCTTACPGTFVYIPRGTPHTFQNLEPRRSRMLVMATPGGIEDYFEDLRPYMWTPSERGDLQPLLHKHHVEVVGPPLGPH